MRSIAKSNEQQAQKDAWWVRNHRLFWRDLANVRSETLCVSLKWQACVLPTTLTTVVMVKNMYRHQRDPHETTRTKGITRMQFEC